MGRGKPPKVVDRLRCTACGHFNPLDRPHGGIYYSRATTETISGETVTLNSDGTHGCQFCGSPALYSGGKLGDMAR